MRWEPFESCVIGIWLQQYLCPCRRHSTDTSRRTLARVASTRRVARLHASLPAPESAEGQDRWTEMHPVPSVRAWRRIVPSTSQSQESRIGGLRKRPSPRPHQNLSFPQKLRRRERGSSQHVPQVSRCWQRLHSQARLQQETECVSPTGSGKGCSESSCQSPRQSCRTLDRDLLAENRPDRQLEAVPAARHA